LIAIAIKMFLAAVVVVVVVVVVVYWKTVESLIFQLISSTVPKCEMLRAAVLPEVLVHIYVSSYHIKVHINRIPYLTQYTNLTFWRKYVLNEPEKSE